MAYKQNNSITNDIVLYQEAVSCLEAIAANVEKDLNYSGVGPLYERCTEAINSLKDRRQHNDFITESLEALLETLSFQQSQFGVDCGTPSLHHSISPGPKRHRTYNADIGTDNNDRQVLVEDMMISCEHLEVRSFDDVAGLEAPKQILKEAFILPRQFPHLFQGVRKPWRQMLMYGPPGTGKTKLAMSLAAELGCPFYTVSMANLFSSWLGESEKLLRDLFHHARQQASEAVIFIDEIDSLCRTRTQTEDESSRRMKTELLVQMEGGLNNSGYNHVFILAATNCPWDLDRAFLRRFSQRLYIPLPDRECRETIILQHFGNEVPKLSSAEWSELMDLTEGYSGADITHLAMAAAFLPIRDLQTAHFWQFTHDNKITPCSSDTLGSMQYTLSKLPADKVFPRAIIYEDFVKASKTSQKSVSKQLMDRYDEFARM